MRVAAALCVFAAVLSAGSGVARAQSGDAARRGLDLAKKGDCVNAVPLLEEAELARHKPTTASALAGCYVALGELVRAAEMYHAIAEEEPNKTFTAADRAAVAAAAKKADDLDARIPVVEFKRDKDYPELEIEVDGVVVGDPDKPRQVPPDTAVIVAVRAAGYQELKQRLVLEEGAHKVVKVHLERDGSAEPQVRGPAGPDEATKPDAKVKGGKWFGGRFRAFLIPKFLMNAFGDGGTDVFAPGAGLFYGTPIGKSELDLALHYTSFGMGPTPYKPVGTPNTEWEIIESNLMALTLSVEIVRVVPLDDAGKWTFRIGGGLGVGWMFLGDLHRTQAYPPKGIGTDPYKLKKCKGPNNPSGTYAYCNQLDKDADHYGDFAEPSWFDGGARPAIYPWVALPEMGLTTMVSKKAALDFELGVSLTGFFGGIGLRYGL